MSKIIVVAEVSIDGALGAGQMEFWQQVFPRQSEDVREYLDGLLALPDALLMGRQTYEVFAAVWPARQGPDADRINQMPKHVASRTLRAPLAWNATLIAGDVAAAIGALKAAPGRGLLQYGVGELTRTMLGAGLVDELRIVIYPFTFGAGPQLFEQMGAHTFALQEVKQFTSGAVALHYQIGQAAA